MMPTHCSRAPRPSSHPIRPARPSNRAYTNGRYMQHLNTLDPNHITPFNLHKVVTSPQFKKDARVLHAYVLENVSSAVLPLAQHLKRSKILETLYLSGMDLTKVELETLCNGLKGNRSIKKLSLSFNKFTDEDTGILAVALHHHPLNVLNLTHNQITGEGAANLAKAIATLENMSCLSIYDNPLEDEGAVVLADALAKKKKCSVLYFDRCKLTSKVVQALAKKTFHHFKEISLAGNQIDDKAVPALEKIVKECSFLKELDLSDNIFTNSIALRIRLEAMQANPTLQLRI